MHVFEQGERKRERAIAGEGQGARAVPRAQPQRGGLAPGEGDRGRAKREEATREESQREGGRLPGEVQFNYNSIIIHYYV